MWKPKEIIVHSSVKDDNATKYFLDRCSNIPIQYVSDSKSKTVKGKSKILNNSGTSMLEQIRAGKQVVFIAPATQQVDEFIIDDSRLLCPCFSRVKFANNGCFYNCDWCFLKLTYRAQRPYITVKAEFDKIKEQLQKEVEQRKEPLLFSSGELADSLSLEHLTGAAQEFIPWFAKTENAYLYMLTKSENVDSILNLEHNKHTIIAWSINNEDVSRKFEIGAPTTSRRLDAAAKVQKAGYPLRIRLDPIVPIEGWKDAYSQTVKQIFERVSPESITIGTLRFEKGFYNQRNRIFSNGVELVSLVDNMVPMFEPKTYPGDKHPKIGKYSFPEEKRIEIFRHVITEIKKYSDCHIALCKESINVWNNSGLDASKCNCACQYNAVDMTRKQPEHSDKKEKRASMKKKFKPEIKNGIEFYKGNNNILVIAPHGVDTEPYDDENTADLTYKIMERLECSAIINRKFRKPEGKEKSQRNRGQADIDKHYLNLNSIGQAKLHTEFMSELVKNVNSKELTYVFWIHGIDNDSIKKEAILLEQYKDKPNQLDALVGYGQGPDRSIHETDKTDLDKADNLTIEEKEATEFTVLLTNEGMNTALTSCSSTNYCARSCDNMNQWFLLNKYSLSKVKSLQLEIKKDGFREKQHLDATAKIIASAISSIAQIKTEASYKKEINEATVQIEDKSLNTQILISDRSDDAIQVEDPTVQKAYDKLLRVFSRNYERALMEAGQYIVRTFYGGEENIEDIPYDENFKFSKLTIENARLKQSPKKNTLNQLYQKIDKNGTSNMPSKAWIYNSVNLVVQWYDIKAEITDSFYTYRNLLLSHKICLLRLPNIEQKKEFISKIQNNKLSVRELTQLISESSKRPDKEKNIYSVINKPDELFSDEYSEKLKIDELNNISIDKLKKIASKMLEQCKRYERERINYAKILQACNTYAEKYLNVLTDVRTVIDYKENPSKNKRLKKSKTKMTRP